MNKLIDKECWDWLEAGNHFWLFGNPEWEDIDNISGKPECLEQWKLANNTQLEDVEYYDYDLISWINFLIQFWKGLVCIMGLLSNSFVIYVFCRYSKMKTVRNTYILHLAISDVLYCIMIPFMITSAVVNYWPFGNTFCKPHHATTNIGYVARPIFIQAMIADRYLTTCHPKTAMKFRSKLSAIFVSFFVWFLSTLFAFPVFIYANTLEIENQTHCEVLWPDWDKITGENVYIMYCFIVADAIPLVLTIIFLIFIIRKPDSGPSLSVAASVGNDGLEPCPEGNIPTEGGQNCQRKVTRLLLAVVAVHYFFATLLWTSYMALEMTPSDSHHYHSMLIIFLLAEGFSDLILVMNPIIYVILSDGFKKSFMKVFSCGPRAKGRTILFNSISENEESDADDIHVANPNNSMTETGIIATSL